MNKLSILSAIGVLAGVGWISGCTDSKGCDTKPIPKSMTEMAELVPPNTRVCGGIDGALRVFYGDATKTTDAFDVLAKHAVAKGWTKTTEIKEGTPTITLVKGPTKVMVNFISFKGDVYASMELGALQ